MHQFVDDNVNVTEIKKDFDTAVDILNENLYLRSVICLSQA